MKRFIPLLVLFAAGAAASFALASPPGKGGPTTGSTTRGNSGNRSQTKCHPVNLKGTVTGGTISVTVTKAAGKNAQQLLGAQTLKVGGNVSVQAWSCAAAASAGSAATTQTLFLKQLHVGGSPQNLGSTTTTTTSSP